MGVVGRWLLSDASALVVVGEGSDTTEDDDEGSVSASSPAQLKDEPAGAPLARRHASNSSSEASVTQTVQPHLVVVPPYPILGPEQQTDVRPLGAATHARRL